MAGEFSPTGSIISSEVDSKTANAATEVGFIPSLWSDEIIATYKSNLVMAPLITRLNHKGKKGDTIFIPSPTRGSATAKSEETQVTLQQSAGGMVGISIDQHYEYSRLIEDFADVQALGSMRRFYTEDAGYALAKQVDTSIMQQAETARGGTAVGGDRFDKGVYFDANGLAGTVASPTDYDYTASAAVNLNDAGIRDSIQYLDDSDVPMDSRFIVVPPSQRNALMGIARFTEQAFVGDTGGGNSIRNGLIGEIYGIPVYVSTNCITTETAGDRIALIGHKSWAALVEQMSVRSQTQYMQQYLATLMTSDTIYGTGELRDDAVLAVAVPA